ncbi:MAG: folylpolyglutamate synthase/dihydrofolate synthase family protein [Sediminicola sp.]|tara:strand:- start:27445 stop:28656 length:1212 start_codon:yes stop_codon:yes gene_type:complete
MTYQQTLDWMFAQLPMYQQKGKSAFNAKLDKIQAFSLHLGRPEKDFKSIHVAGTNGKGSSSHMLASILQEAGYNVGLYTSPHLKDFRERIRINGEMVGQDYVVKFIAENTDFLRANKLSFFEMTVGMAFQYFTQKKVDIAIIEVGLGGRLDSTNIIDPEVSLITNIGFDHMDILGSTLPLIAREKAGIIKRGVPVVISEYQEEIADVFTEVAHKERAPIIFASQRTYPDYKTDLLGNYQRMNVKGVLACLERLSGFEIPQEAIADGLLRVVANTGLMGRWQVLRQRPQVVCDTAHNSEGLGLVLAQVAQQTYGTLHLVLGFVKDKKLEAILPILPQRAHYYFCSPAIERGLDPSILMERAHEYGLEGDVHASVSEAYKAALENAEKEDFIYIGGSNFVVAEVV